MNTDILKSLQTYAKIYASIGTVPRSRDEIRSSLKEFKDKQSDNTIRNHLNDTFDGKLPLVTIKDDKAVLNAVELRNFIEGMCKTLGTDAMILFSGPAPAPKGRKETDAPIPTIDEVKPSPAMVNLKKSLADQKNEFGKREKDLLEQLDRKDGEITELIKRIKEDVTKAILTESDKKIVVVSSITSDPDEVFRRDFFLDKPNQVVAVQKIVGKSGGERTSFYESLPSSKLVLTTEKYCRRIVELLCKSKFFENRCKDEERLRSRNASEEDIRENRKKSIQMIIEDDDMSNQMKLAYQIGL